MVRIHRQQQALQGKVGRYIEDLIEEALKPLEEKGIIKDLTSQQDLSTEGEDDSALHFITDIEFTREIDDKKVVIWATHRKSAENSDTYFWGLVNQVTQVWKSHGDVISILAIMGDARTWKGWIYSSATLIFDYVYFIGSNHSMITEFEMKNAADIENEIKTNNRLTAHTAEDVEHIFRDIKKNIADAKTREEAIIEIIKSVLKVENLTNNPYVLKLKEEILNYPVSPINGSIDDINEHNHKEGILIFLLYTLLLFNNEVTGIKFRELCSDFYQNERHFYTETLADEIIERLESSKILVIEDDNLINHSEMLLPVLDRTCPPDSNGNRLVINIYKEFIYELFYERTIKSPQQETIFISFEDSFILEPEELLDKIKEDIKESRTRNSLISKIEYYMPAFKFRYHSLKNQLDQLEREGIIIIEQNTFKFGKTYNFDEVDIDVAILPFDLLKRTYQSESNIQDLIGIDIEEIVSGLNTIMTITNIDERLNALKTFILERNSYSLRTNAIIASYWCELTAKEIENEIDTGRAATGIHAFMRGAPASAESEEYISNGLAKMIEKKKNMTHPTNENLHEAIIDKRVQQIKRNIKLNILEEQVRLHLEDEHIPFFGGPSRCSDAPLAGLYGSLDLHMPVGRSSLRGEDFIIPLSNGKWILIACRASPQSYEAQRMGGHSLQFIVHWNGCDFELDDNYVHCAIVDGRWKGEWIGVLRGSVFEKVYSGKQMPEFVEWLCSLEALYVEDEDEYKSLMNDMSRYQTDNRPVDCEDAFSKFFV